MIIPEPPITTGKTFFYVHTNITCIKTITVWENGTMTKLAKGKGLKQLHLGKQNAKGNGNVFHSFLHKCIQGFSMIIGIQFVSCR